MESDHVSKRSVKQENEYNNYSIYSKQSNILNIFVIQNLNFERIKVEMKLERLAGRKNLIKYYFLNKKLIKN